MNRPIEIYLLDDDPVFLNAFAHSMEVYLQQQPRPFRLSTFVSSEKLLTQAASAERVDLLITDIDLGAESASGIQVARQLRCDFPACRIIFLTAFLAYATDIYDTRPLYFIVKDEYQQRIPAAMALFFEDYASRQENLMVTSDHIQTVVPLQELIYCERVGRKTNLVCTDRQLLISDTIAELMEKLPQKKFIICHKGYIVGLERVKSYCRYTITLKTGHCVPVSRSHYDAFRAAFAEFLSG